MRNFINPLAGSDGGAAGLLQGTQVPHSQTERKNDKRLRRHHPICHKGATWWESRNAPRGANPHGQRNHNKFVKRGWSAQKFDPVSVPPRLTTSCLVHRWLVRSCSALRAQSTSRLCIKQKQETRQQKPTRIPFPWQKTMAYVYGRGWKTHEHRRSTGVQKILPTSSCYVKMLSARVPSTQASTVIACALKI